MTLSSILKYIANTEKLLLVLIVLCFCVLSKISTFSLSRSELNYFQTKSNFENILKAAFFECYLNYICEFFKIQTLYTLIFINRVVHLVLSEDDFKL